MPPPQDQQRFDHIAGACGVDQLQCDLGGAAGKATGDEVQDADAAPVHLRLLAHRTATCCLSADRVAAAGYSAG